MRRGISPEIQRELLHRFRNLPVGVPIFDLGVVTRNPKPQTFKVMGEGHG